MEEIKKRIENIIINGLLVTSNEVDTDFRRIYSKQRLNTLVGSFLTEYVFEDVSPETKQWFYSDEGNVGLCTRIIFPGDSYYYCKNCELKENSIMCYECFLHSEHVNHEYSSRNLASTEKTCNCGDVDAWKNHSTCSRHFKTDSSERILPESFLDKIRQIIQYLCQLLEEICNNDCTILDTHVEEMLNAYLRTQGSNTLPNISHNHEITNLNNSIDANSLKSCLLVLNDGKNDLEKFIDFLRTVHNVSHDDSAAVEVNIKEYGYAVIHYLSSFDECKKFKESLEHCSCMIFNAPIVHIRIAKIYRLYFMRLAPILMNVINKLCFGKTQLCELLSEIVFAKTSLAQVFVTNEHLLWRDLRHEMIVRIFMVAKYSNSGRKYAAWFFLNNITHLYTHFVLDKRMDSHYYMILIFQIMHVKSVFVYLVEHGFLCRMIDVCSNLLKTLGIGAGADLGQLYIQSKTKLLELFRIFEANTHLCSCLRVSLNETEVSIKFRSRLTEAGKRLVQLCFDFDDMEPKHKNRDEKTEPEKYDYLILLYGSLFLIMFNLVKWLHRYDDIAKKTLDSFLKQFSMDIKHIYKKPSDDPANLKIITYCNVETDKFSLFNLSRRVFLNLFMDCCIKETLSPEIKSRVLNDKRMLMWICCPAITALSFTANFLSASGKDMKHMDPLVFIYMKAHIVNILYLQDFHAVQLLISYLDPEVFLKYMLFNLAPSIQNRVDFSMPLSSILLLQEFDCGSILNRLLILVYNALVERHFIGVYGDPEYRLLERQLIHSLASGHQSMEKMINHIVMYCEMYMTLSYSPLIKNTLNEVLRTVSVIWSSKDSENEISLKPEYFNLVNIFYFMNNLSDVHDTHQNIMSICKTHGWKFQIPEVVELRQIFDGMNDFLFSDAFSDLIMRIMVDWWHTNLRPNKNGSVDNLILASMSLCLILKASLSRKKFSRFHKTFDSIFGICRDIGFNSVMTLLAFLRKTINSDIYDCIVDYLMELSQIPINYFDDLSDKPLVMMNKSSSLRDLAWETLKNMYQEISENYEESRRSLVDDTKKPFI